MADINGGIEIRNLVKTYAGKDMTSVTAIDNMSVVLPAGKMVFITGKSGSGKSSLLNILGLIDGFDSGEVVIDGAEVSKFTPAEKNYYRSRKIGFVFQEYNIIEKYNIGQNIALSLDISGNDKNERETVERALTQVGLEGFYKRKSNQMSGGQRQRVAIARAIIKNPDIVLADEPTGALDTVTSAEIFKILKKLSKEKTVIVVSHDIESARKWGDIIYQMRDGKIIHTEAGGEVTETVLADKTGAFDAAAVKNHIESGRSVTIRAYHKPEKPAKAKAAATGSLPLEVFHDTHKTPPAAGKEHGVVENTPNRLQSAGKPLKNHLPVRQTFKIAGMAMLAGKVRLGITLVLCSLVLALFGFSLMFGAFDTKKMVVNEVRENKTPFVTVRPLIENGTDMLGGTQFLNTSYKELAYDILDKNGISYLKKNNVPFAHTKMLQELGVVNRPDYTITGTKYNPVVSSFAGTAEFYKGFEKDLERTNIKITGDMDEFAAKPNKLDWGGAWLYEVPVLITSYHLEIIKLLTKKPTLTPADIMGKTLMYFAVSSNVSYRYVVAGVINYDLTVFDSVMAIQKKGDRSGQTKEQNRTDYLEISKLAEQLESYLNYVYVANGVFDTLATGFFSSTSAASISMSALPYFNQPENGVTFALWQRYLSYLGVQQAAGVSRILSLTEYYAIVQELGSVDNNQLIWAPTIPSANSFVNDTTMQNMRLTALDDDLFSYEHHYATVKNAGLEGFITDYMENAYATTTDTGDGVPRHFSSNYELYYSSYGYQARGWEADNINDGKLSTPASFIQQENAPKDHYPILGVNAADPSAEFDHDKTNPYITLILDFGSEKTIDAIAFWHTLGYNDIHSQPYGLYIPAVPTAPVARPLWIPSVPNNPAVIIDDARTDWTRINLNPQQWTLTAEVKDFHGITAIISTFNEPMPVTTRYLAVVVHRGAGDNYLQSNEIQVSFTSGADEKHSYVLGTDYNLAQAHIGGLLAAMVITPHDVNGSNFADINNTTDGVVLMWEHLRAIMPSQLWSSYYQTKYFEPDKDNLHQMANIIWYLMENDIFGKTVYLQQKILNGDDNYSAVNDIPVKILGIAVNFEDTSPHSFITKHLLDKLQKTQMAYSVSTVDDILIPYANRGEIEKIYDKLNTDEFARYIKNYNKMTGANILEQFTSIKSNPLDYWSTDSQGDTNKKYILSVNGATIAPIYSIDKIFGLFNSIFKIIAIALIVIMIILLWSFMSFTIKTRTKDIGILISLGASKRDIADIFIIEGGLIAAGQIIFSLVTAVIAKHFVRNYMIRRMGDVIRDYNILAFGIWQILIMVGIAVAVTAVSTAMPLWGLARKQPVEIIRKIET